MIKKLKSLNYRQVNILDHNTYFKSAVLLPLIYIEDELCILFEKRSSTIKIQPGEICFPGGHVEEIDANPKDTAIRETIEELGLSKEDIEILFPLDFVVSPFNAIIYPFVGFVKDNARITPNEDEVENVFFVPVTFFINNKPRKENLHLGLHAEQTFPFHLIPQGKDYPFRKINFPQLFYLWNNEVIWGLTARILYHFIELYKSEHNML